MEKKILVIGESFMNLKMQVNPTRKDTSTVEGGAYSYHAAGKSVLTAVTISKLGGEVAFCTKLGKDANGDQLIRYYEKCGLSSELMTQSASAQTGLSVSMYDDLGNQTSYLSHGAGSLFSREDVDAALATYPDVLIVPQDAIKIPYEVEVEETVPGRNVTVEAENSDNESKAFANSEEEKEETETETEAEAEAEEGKAKAETEKGEKTAEFPVAEAESDNFEAGAEQDNKAKAIIDSLPSFDKQTVRKMEFDDLNSYAISKARHQQVDLIMEYSENASRLPGSATGNLKVLILSGEDVFVKTGFYPDSKDKALRALAFFRDRFSAKYYIICSKSGALVCDGLHHEYVEPPRELIRASGERPFPLQVFTGAFTAEFYRCRRPVRAAKYALTAALIAYSQFRTLDYIPSRKDLDASLIKYNIELD